MAHRLTWLDVFTSRPLAGNGLAVVHDADDLDELAMLRFARETGLSETTFVQAPQVPDADYRTRIWTSTRELDFAGHPSLGTAVAVAVARGERDASFRQETRAGVQPVEVETRDDGVAFAWMLLKPATFGPELEADRALRALGLDAADAHPELPPQVVATGVPQVLVPVRAPEVLDRVRPEGPALLELLRDHDAVTAYLAAPGDGGHVDARSFMEGHGERVVEDAATGSAAGPLCAYLQARAGVEAIEIVQGVAMGRPSVLRCRAGERVRVEGDAVVLAEGKLYL